MRWLVLVVAVAQAACSSTRACKPAGGVLFEVAQRTIDGVERITATPWKTTRTGRLCRSDQSSIPLAATRSTGSRAICA